MIKIDIISGFLGAGKTTLIAKLLKEKFQNEKVILIENEFGEIGIDSGFLKSTGIEIREMNSGCICCSLVGDFGTALKEVTEKYSPDRIIIEPSGVGKLSDVIKAVQDAGEKIEGGIKINCAATVVDVMKCKIHLKNFGEFYTNQIESAGTVILTRTDLEKATQEKVDEAVALIREHNPNVTIITTPIAQLNADKLLKVMEEGGEDIEKQLMEEAKEHHHHHHDEDDDHDEHCCGHHHHHDDDDDDHDEHCCGHHHHDDDDDDHDEHCCGHHHHHDDDDDDHDEHDHDHHDHDHDGHCCCGHHHHHHGHDADEVFTSWGRETSKKYTKDEVEKIVKELCDNAEYGQILRAKGILACRDGSWEYFDMVPGECEVRDGEPEFTGRICVIGTNLDEDKIAELFGI